MQNDLISRKPLVDMLQGVEDDIFAEATREVNPKKAYVSGVVQEVKNQVLALPAVDAVEVVRCMECKHYGRDNKSKLGFRWCNKLGNIVTNMDFCSYGVRREG